VRLATGHLYNHVMSLAEARRGESLACGHAPTWVYSKASKQTGQLGLALGWDWEEGSKVKTPPR